MPRLPLPPLDPREARALWLEAERVRTTVRLQEGDYPGVCAARLRLVNREADQYHGGYKTKRNGGKRA